jgi:hypothetical protein
MSVLTLLALLLASRAKEVPGDAERAGRSVHESYSTLGILTMLPLA